MATPQTGQVEMNHLMMTGMMNLRRTVIMKTTAGMTDTHNIVTRIDRKIAETETVMTGTGPVLHTKKENVTSTLRTPPPGVGAL